MRRQSSRLRLLPPVAGAFLALLFAWAAREGAELDLAQAEDGASAVDYEARHKPGRCDCQRGAVPSAATRAGRGRHEGQDRALTVVGS